MGSRTLTAAAECGWGACGATRRQGSRSITDEWINVGGLGSGVVGVPHCSRLWRRGWGRCLAQRCNEAAGRLLERGPEAGGGPELEAGAWKVSGGDGLTSAAAAGCRRRWWAREEQAAGERVGLWGTGGDRGWRQRVAVDSWSYGRKKSDWTDLNFPDRQTQTSLPIRKLVKNFNSFICFKNHHYHDINWHHVITLHNFWLLYSIVFVHIGKETGIKAMDCCACF